MDKGERLMEERRCYSHGNFMAVDCADNVIVQSKLYDIDWLFSREAADDLITLLIRILQEDK